MLSVCCINFSTVASEAGETDRGGAHRRAPSEGLLLLLCLPTPTPPCIGTHAKISPRLCDSAMIQLICLFSPGLLLMTYLFSSLLLLLCSSKIAFWWLCDFSLFVRLFLPAHGVQYMQLIIDRPHSVLSDPRTGLWSLTHS